MVINYIVEDPGKLRGLDYTVVQHVMSASAANTDQDAYFRYARPAQSIFGEWKKAHFDEDNYYDKPEVDDLIADRLALINVEDGPQDNQVDLQQKNISTDQVLSFARFEGSGAITVTSAPGNKIIIDTPALNPLTFMGLIDLNEDPDVKLGAIPAAAGMYFIFTDAGLYTYTGDTVAVGDWLIYNDQTPGWEVISYAGSYGVAEVGLTPDGYLEDRGSSPAYPQLGIDMSKWKKEQPSIESQGHENQYEYLSNLIDVVVPKTGEMNTSVEYDKRVYTEADLDGSAEPNPGGRFFIDMGNRTLKLEQFDKNQVNLNSGWWIAASNNRKYAIFDTDLARRERANFLPGYEITMRPTAMAKLASHGSFTITPFTNYAPDQQDAILWSNSVKAWVTGDPADGKYLSLKGGTVDGDVTIKGELNVEGHIEMESGAIQGEEIATKDWVLSQVGGVAAVPAGLIAFWASSDTIPAGWLPLDGRSYNVVQNPIMNQVVQNMYGAQPGKLPNWEGHFIHHRDTNETYHKNGGRPGQKVAQTTGNSSTADGITMENAGRHTHTFRTFVGTGAGDTSGQNIQRPITSTSKGGKRDDYPGGDGDKDYIKFANAHSHDLIGFDTMTRPKSVNGYWIIKTG